MNSKDAYAPSLAERHAVEVAAGWERLESGRKILAQHKARELAETEARSLAQIRAEAERTLANQSIALKDAEQAAEMAAIERRTADREAEREAQRRQALDLAASTAASARQEADRQAETAALARKLAADQALAARQSLIEAERQARQARASCRRTRIGAAWATLRAASPVKLGLAALLFGLAGGLLIARFDGQAAFDATDGEPHLKFETELSVSAAKK